MPRKHVTRKIVNDPTVDAALRDIYDELDALQPEMSAKYSKRPPQIGDVRIVETSDGGTATATLTQGGWMVDINSNFQPVSGTSGFKSLKGTRGTSRTPVKNESIKYDKNNNVAIGNVSKGKIILKNSNNQLKVRDATDSNDAPVTAKQLRVTGGTATNAGDITYTSSGDIVNIVTNKLFIPGSLIDENIQTNISIVSKTNYDATISLGDSSLTNWTLGYDHSDSGKFKIDSVTNLTLRDASSLELDTSGNLLVAGTITDGSGNTLGAADITGVTITTDSGGGSAASDTSGSADFSILGANGVGVTNSGTTITAAAVPGEIDHDSLSNFVANEHIDWTASSAGTIHSSNYSAGASALNDLSDVTYSSGDLTISSLDKIIADDFVIDSGASIELDSHNGNFIAKKAGTEFSADNSSYAGMILGYTKIQNNNTGSSHALITMDATLTVLQTVTGTNLSITFKAPPSGNVEIQMLASLYASSKTVELALSDNATFNEIDESYTYDGGAQSSDETDLNMTTISFVVTGLTAGSSYTYYIGGAETSSGTSYFRHGRFRTTGTHYPPIIIKAIALPATIITGE